MYKLTQKLDNIRRNVEGWAKSSFGDFFKIKGDVEEKLKKLQGDIVEGMSLDSVTREKEEYRKNWKDILLREEIFWKQRSRIQWFKEEDKNTTFFHRSASNHKRRNTINRLDGEGGRIYKDQEDMGRHAMEYFSKAYFKDNNIGNSVIRRSLINMIPQILGMEENYHILGNITEEEVKCAVFSMKAYKAPGLDGFPSTFF